MMETKPVNASPCFALELLRVVRSFPYGADVALRVSAGSFSPHVVPELTLRATTAFFRGEA